MNLKPEELVKALRHCSNDYPCKTCPVELQKDESTCIGVLFKHCIDQIERDQKEIAELREENERLTRRLFEPHKVSWMKEVVEAAFDNDTSRIERAHNLHVADKEGRVVVLPCKVGDTIWRLKRTFETYPDKSKPYTEADGFLLQDIWNVGKNVFLTREEAEKALAEMEGKG